MLVGLIFMSFALASGVLGTIMEAFTVAKAGHWHLSLLARTQSLVIIILAKPFLSCLPVVIAGELEFGIFLSSSVQP